MILAALLLAAATVTGAGAVLCLMAGWLGFDRGSDSTGPLLASAAVLAGIAVPLLYLFEQVRP